MTTFVARPNRRGNLTLLADGVRFGSLTLGREGRVVGGSFADDEVRAAHRRLRISGNNPSPETVADHLWFCRRAFELVAEDRLADQEAQYEVWVQSLGDASPAGQDWDVNGPQV